MFKRLIKKSSYSLEYEPGDVINNFDITNLVVSNDGLYKAYSDVISGRKSQTNEPLSIHINNNNEFMLVDGYHRLVDLLFTSQQYTNIQILSVGYTDYWAYPKEKFKFDFSLKWNGLEEFSDDETLESDYEDIYI